LKDAKLLNQLKKQLSNLQNEKKKTMPEEKVCRDQSTKSDEPNSNRIQQSIIQEYQHQIDSLSKQMESLNQSLHGTVSKLQ
jgi:hypothetical protein